MTAIAPSTAASFYVTGGTLPPDALSYVERQADRDLLAALRQGEYCYVLNSRQMGKSSLCVRAIARLREEGARTVFLDLTKFGGRNLTAEQWYAALLAEVGRELGLRAECLAYWKEHPELPPVQRLFGAITEVALGTGVQAFGRSGVQEGMEEPHLSAAGPERLNARTPERLVVFVDEIDVTRSLPFSTDEFFAAIRQCCVGRATEPLLQGVTFCLLGTATPAELIEDTRISPFNIGRRIEVRDFTAEEAAPLAWGLAAGSAGVPPACPTTDQSATQHAGETHALPAVDAQRLLERILHWTGGHPYLTQRLCRAVAEHVSSPTLNPPPTATLVVDRLSQALFLTHTAKEGDDNLALVRNRLLKSDVDLAALLELYGKVRAGKHVPVDDTNPLVDVLRLSGITRVADDRRPTTVHRRGLSAVVGGRWSVVAPSLVVRNRIYAHVFDREWARQHMPDAEVRRQRAAFQRGVLRAAGIAVTVLVAMGVLTFTAVRSEVKAKRLAQQREAERQATRRLLYASDMNVAHQDWETAHGGRMMELLNAHRPRPGEEDLRGFEWFYLWRLAHGHRFALKRDPPLMPPVLFSPDGRQLATGSEDGTIRLWDAAAGREIRALAGHRGEILHLRFSPDGQILESVGEDGTVRSWELTAAHGIRSLTRWTRSRPGRRTVVSVNGDTLAVGAADHPVTLRDLTTGRVIRTLPTGPISTIAFSPDGETLATGKGAGAAGLNETSTISLWEVKTGRRVRVLRLEGRQLKGLTFSPDGGRLAVGNFQGWVGTWDVATGRPIRSFQAHRGYIHSLVFFPDGRRLVTGSRDSTAKIWDLASGRVERTLKGQKGEVWHAALSSDGNRVATIAGYEGIVSVWDAVQSGKPPLPRRQGHPALRLGAFSPDGKSLAIGDRTSVSLRDLATGHERWRSTGAGWHLEFSPDGKLLASRNEEGTVTLWDATTGRVARTFNERGTRSPVGASLAFSPDGETLASRSGNSEITLWEVATGRKRWRRERAVSAGLSAAFSSDGRTLAVGQGMIRGRRSTIQLLDAATGQFLRSLEGHNSAVSSLAFSPDGRMLASVSWDTTGALWDTATGRKIRTFQNPMLLTSVAFSPDGRRLATGDGGGTVKLWDVATAREILALRGLTLDVKVAFSPDGRRLAAGATMGGEVMLWEAASREEVAAREAKERRAAAP